MSFTEDELLPISALQHWLFCPRQCALIHLEQLWAENQLTMEGLILHERADQPEHKTKGNVRVQRALPIRSLTWGLIGKADVVEFHLGEDGDVIRVLPVEYKRGRPKKNDCDRVQLCAQAICLAEMCGTDVTEGALFYGEKRRRTEVVFDEPLLHRTHETIQSLRQMILAQITPDAIRTPACKKCSLIELCLPDATDGGRDVSRFMARQFSTHLGSDGPESDDDHEGTL